MEIFLIFVLSAIFVLGALCLIVLEYQNHRTKRWQQSFTPPPLPVRPKPAPTSNKDTLAPARVA